MSRVTVAERIEEQLADKKRINEPLAFDKCVVYAHKFIE